MPGTSKLSYFFHPLELAVSGYSGSGKTTLLEKLAVLWREAGRRFAYAKHDAHHFSMDHPGKDSHRLTQAGASGVLINDWHHHAYMGGGSRSELELPALLAYDFVVVEGYKTLPLPKLVMLDLSCAILEELTAHDPDFSYCLAFVGPWKQPPPELTRRTSARAYFNRDEVDLIRNFVDSYFTAQLRARPLNGLILAGGRSQRMGQDKALLSYQSGKNQLEHCAALLSPHCGEVFVSGREASMPSIADSFRGLGPLSGILSALQYRPKAAWLVLAIDLPGLRPQTLATLVGARCPWQFASAFRAHPCEHKPEPAPAEPLCAIYEPKCYGAFLSLLGRGFSCPTRLLAELPINLIAQESGAQDLTNVNTPEERERLRWGQIVT